MNFRKIMQKSLAKCYDDLVIAQDSVGNFLFSKAVTDEDKKIKSDIDKEIGEAYQIICDGLNKLRKIEEKLSSE